MILGHVALTKIKCIPMNPMVESDVAEGGKNPASFFFSWMNTTTQTWSLKLQVILEEKQQLVEEKDADNIRKVLCKY